MSAHQPEPMTIDVSLKTIDAGIEVEGTTSLDMERFLAFVAEVDGEVTMHVLWTSESAPNDLNKTARRFRTRIPADVLRSAAEGERTSGVIIIQAIFREQIAGVFSVSEGQIHYPLEEMR